MIQSGYPWPSSALTVQDMKMLYYVQKSLSPKVPITQLIAQAVRAMYMNITPAPCAQTTTTNQKEAA